MAGKSWMSPVRLVVELRLRNDNYDCWQMHKRIIVELCLRDRIEQYAAEGGELHAHGLVVEMGANRILHPGIRDQDP